MTKLLLLLALILALLGCAAEPTVIPVAKPDKAESPSVLDTLEKPSTISSAELVRQFESEAPAQYLIGPGDKLAVTVAGRPELSGEHTVGPDGNITIPFAGMVQVLDLDRDQAAKSIKNALLAYYLDVYITVSVVEYTSNRVVVLGRVDHPGVVHFEDNPTLIELLSRVGGLSVQRPEQKLFRCAVLRGDKILWLDLQQLLNGDLSLNIRLRRDDVVYIPDTRDTTVYVLGEVNKPGIYPLMPKMLFLDALGQAGGPNSDANTDEIRLIRPSQGLNQEVALDRILAPDRSLNVALEDGDIVYVPRRGIADVGYFLRQVNPFVLLLSIQSLTNN